MTNLDTIMNLDTMRLPELQAKYEEVVGRKTRAPNKTFLKRKIREVLEAQQEATPEPEAAPEQPAETEAQPEPVAQSKAPKAKGRRLAPPRAQQAGTPNPPTAKSDAEGGQKLKDLDVPALQALYVEVVGRPTKSSDKNYLMWKIRQAQQGKVPVGPRESRKKASDEEQKVLAMRFPKQVVDAIDEAWRRHGKKNRMEMIREAFAMWLQSHGEDAGFLD